jgi:hypothetical protein
MALNITCHASHCPRCASPKCLVACNLDAAAEHVAASSCVTHPLLHIWPCMRPVVHFLVVPSCRHVSLMVNNSVAQQGWGCKPSWRPVLPLKA